MRELSQIKGYTFRALMVGAIGLFNVFTSTPLAAIEFDLLDTGATTEIESGVITRGGITATLTAIVDGNTGELNQSSTTFGINATGTGDESSRLDGDEGAESVSITFDVDIVWSGLGLSLFSSGEAAGISLPLVSSTALADTGSGSDAYTFTTGNLVLVGESVVLSWVSGNGFSFDSFSVELYEEPKTSGGSGSVPDGGLSALMLLGGIGLVAVSRRLIHSN